MRTSMKGLMALALLSASAPAFAQEEAPPSDITVTGSVTLVSDYRFRGISQTDEDFAVQGGVTIAHSSGVYAAVWGSSISEYVAAGGDQEIDFSIGYSTEVAPGTVLDVGALYYYYPGAESIVPGYNSDFLETYASVKHTFGPASVKVLMAYAPKQSALSVGAGSEDNLYVAADLGVGIPDTPISLSAHFGHSFGPSYLTIGDEYSDWSLGASYTTGPVTFGVSYVDAGNGAFISPSGRDIADGAVLFSVGAAF